MDFNSLATTDLTAKDIDFVSDRVTGRCMIIHNKPFARQSTLAAVQCDAATGLLTFIAQSGERQTVNIPVLPPVLDQFLKAREVTVVLTQDGNINDMHQLPLSAVNK